MYMCIITDEMYGVSMAYTMEEAEGLFGTRRLCGILYGLDSSYVGNTATEAEIENYFEQVYAELEAI